MSKVKLDLYEKELLDSYERGEWKSSPDLEEELKMHRSLAAKTLKKDKRVNIRMSSKDLEEIKAMAIEDGIPYQTLMSSILHRYITGRLVDKSPRVIDE